MRDFSGPSETWTRKKFKRVSASSKILVQVKSSSLFNYDLQNKHALFNNNETL